MRGIPVVLSSSASCAVALLLPNNAIDVLLLFWYCCTRCGGRDREEEIMHGIGPKTTMQTKNETGQKIPRLHNNKVVLAMVNNREVGEDCCKLYHEIHPIPESQTDDGLENIFYLHFH